jgi:hypothetical protein
VATYNDNGNHRWAGVSRSGDWANRWWASSDINRLFRQPRTPPKLCQHLDRC